MIDRVLGGYRLVQKLAEGGMGEVYLAEHLKLGRRAAVKVLRLEYCRDAGNVERFLKEAQAVNAIRHPAIVDIYDFGRDTDGRAFFVMELLEGEPLSKRIARGPLHWREALAIATGIVAPLAAAHDKGFVHRDLKPDNVWLTYDPFQGIKVKLLDFGIAKLIGGDQSAQQQFTKTGAVIGTPQYMAPEQINGKPVDARTDVYALGIIVHEMLRGAPPFGGETLAALLMAHILNEPPRLDNLHPAQEVAPWVADVVARMLSKEPAGRPATARAALTELEGGQTLVTPRRASPARRRWPWLALAAALLLGAAATVFAAWPRPAAVEPPPTAAAPPPAPVTPVEPRPRAVVDYEKLRRDALSLLRSTLGAAEPATRVAGSDALGEVLDVPSLPALVELARGDADLEARGHAAAAAGAIGPNAKQKAALAALERDAPPALRVWYTEALARSGDAAARGRLGELAASPDLPVALRASLALGDLSKPGDAIAALRLTALAAREAELEAIAPHAGAAIRSRLARLRDARARDRLVTALGEGEERARLAAAEGLARLGDDSGRELATAVLANAASPHRLIAASILVALGDYSGYPLASSKLEDPDGESRRVAARVLGQIGEKQSAPALAALLADGSAPVRIAAAEALVAVVGLDPGLLAQASVDWARAALASEDWAVRASAAAMVGEVREGDAVVLLAQALVDPEPEVRGAAAAGAKKLGGPRAARTLAAAARVERDPVTRERMVRSFGGQAGEVPEAKSALVKIAKEKGRAGVLAAGALAKLGDGGARARVEAALGDDDAAVREAAVEAASWAGLAPALAGAVADRGLGVRLLAAEALVALKATSPEAVSVLQEALVSDDPTRQARATVALVRAGERVDAAASAAQMLSSTEVATRIAGLAIVAVLPPAVALPLVRRALFDSDVGVRVASMAAVAELLASARDGAIPLAKAALRDPDEGVRARAQALLARVLEPILPPEAADVPALKAALDELRAARDEVGRARAGVEARAGEIDRAAAVPPNGEEALEAMRRLLEALEAAAAPARAARARANQALARAEAAGGDQPAGEVATLLDEARRTADEASAGAAATAEMASEAAETGRAYLARGASAATPMIADAEASLAAGKLPDALRDLDRAAKMLRAEGKDPADLRFAYGELYEKMAAKARGDGERRKLLEKAKQSYDEFAAARGTDARAPTARARSAAIAELLKRIPPRAPGRAPEDDPDPDDGSEGEQDAPSLVLPERIVPVPK